MDEYIPGKHSIIKVSDFESPKALAAYLKMLDENDEEYARYFEWKKEPLYSGWLQDRCAYKYDAHTKKHNTQHTITYTHTRTTHVHPHARTHAHTHSQQASCMHCFFPLLTLFSSLFFLYAELIVHIFKIRKCATHSLISKPHTRRKATRNDFSRFKNINTISIIMCFILFIFFIFWNIKIAKTGVINCMLAVSEKPSNRPRQLLTSTFLLFLDCCNFFVMESSNIESIASPSLLSLPTDVLAHHILKEFDIPILVICAHVCSQLHKISSRQFSELPHLKRHQNSILKVIFLNGWTNLLSWFQAELHYPSLTAMSELRPGLLEQCLSRGAKGLCFIFIVFFLLILLICYRRTHKFARDCA